MLRSSCRFTMIFSLMMMMMTCLIYGAASASNMARPPRNDVSNMADAIKYLQELDSYYSNVARPREIRNNEELLYDENASDLETAIQLLRLETIDRIYSKHTRPRFGKRANVLQILKDQSQDNNDLEDWQTKLFAQR